MSYYNQHQCCCHQMMVNSLLFPHKKQLISQRKHLAQSIVWPIFNCLCRHVDTFLALRLYPTLIFCTLKRLRQNRHPTLVSAVLARHLSCGSILFPVFIFLLSLALPNSFLWLCRLPFYNSTRQFNTTNTTNHRSQSSFHSTSSANYVSIKIILLIFTSPHPVNFRNFRLLKCLSS